jgi:hypothetical protein
MNELLKSFENEVKYKLSTSNALARYGLSPTGSSSSGTGWWDWAKNKVFGGPSTTDFRGIQPKTGLGTPPGMGMGTGMRPGLTPQQQMMPGRTLSGIIGQRQTGFTGMPPAPIGTLPSIRADDLRRQISRPAFATSIDPETGKAVTMAVTQLKMESAADYKRLQTAIMSLDPAKVKEFMMKLGDIAATLPATQSAAMLEHMQRRVINELDKYCIRTSGWTLFNEDRMRCE